MFPVIEANINPEEKFVAEFKGFMVVELFIFVPVLIPQRREVAQNSRSRWKRFDAGANFLAGYELGNNLSFQLNAQLGMLNIRPEVEGSNDNNSTLKNTGFGISVGYKL